MERMAADFIGRIRSASPWRSALRFSILVAVVLAVLAAAFTAFIVLLPIAIIGGMALRLYLKRRLTRRMQTDRVIEGEYTVLDR